MGLSAAGAKPGIRLNRLNTVMIVVALAASLALLYATGRAIVTYQALIAHTETYITAQQAAAAMQEASDYLTAQTRIFTITGDPESVTRFFTERDETRRRDRAIEEIRAMAMDSEALAHLERAMTASSDLVEVEFHAMRLKIASMGQRPEDYPAAVNQTPLTREEAALSPEAQLALSQELVFGEAYQQAKDEISASVRACTQSLIDTTYRLQLASSGELLTLLRRQQLLTLLLLVIVLVIVLLCYLLLIRPIQRGVRAIRGEQPMPEAGADEVRFLARSYNEMYERTRHNTEKLSWEATHDGLTGLLNRKAYDQAMAAHSAGEVALIIMDVDDFKGINDTWGHAVGDLVLKRVAGAVQESFRSEDYVCRIGGDEFAVLMLHATSDLRGLVLGKITRISEKLRQEVPGQPPLTLSVGVAFSDRECPEGSLFRAADAALYRVKKKGRNGCEIYA